MRVKTNRVPRDFLDTLTTEERKEFDWLPQEEETGFFRYHGEVYHLSQFERFPDPYWQGVHCTSMTTGVVVRLTEEGVIVGHYPG